MADYEFENTNEPYTNPNLNEEEDYTENDLRHVLTQGSFQSWNEVIDWLHNYGGEDNFLHPGKVKNMHDDMVAFRDADQEFSTDASELYEKIKNYQQA